MTTDSLPSFGIITGNTGGEWLKANPRAALRKIAEWGYRELEFGGSFDMEPAELRAFLAELGLNPLIGSTGMAALIGGDQLGKDIALCQALGKKYIACYWPWTDDGKNKSLDDWKRVADNLNRGGEICKREGLSLIYHNHDIEFKLTEGQLPFDVLLPALDPEYVNIELDLYWIAKGNSSAEDYIRKYPGRYPVFHVKDMDKTAERSFACVGDGIINFPSIFKLNSVAGVKHFIVEHDRPADPEDCVRRSAEYLKTL
ncbi:MAG: sugar phosphate isomerase/epimerase [Tannerellaceae bacterium]|nr:sugar phosphate isomerase/epimerase [Tannerellaceae bacterium]